MDMDQEMLHAAQQAAWAGQSAAEAAWWGLLLNGIAASAAVGALWYGVIKGAQAAKLDRLKIGSVCYSVGSDLEVIASSYLGDDGDVAAIKVNAEHLIKSGAISRARRQLELASTIIIPDAKAQDEVGYMAMILDFIEDDIANGGDGRGDAGEIQHAADHFKTLSHKYLGRFHPYPSHRPVHLKPL